MSKEALKMGLEALKNEKVLKEVANAKSNETNR